MHASFAILQELLHEASAYSSLDISVKHAKERLRNVAIALLHDDEVVPQVLSKSLNRGFARDRRFERVHIYEKEALGGEF